MFKKYLNKIIDARFDSFFSRYGKRVEELKRKISHLKKTITELEKKIDEVKNDEGMNRARINNLEKK